MGDTSQKNQIIKLELGLGDLCLVSGVAVVAVPQLEWLVSR